VFLTRAFLLLLAIASPLSFSQEVTISGEEKIALDGPIPAFINVEGLSLNTQDWLKQNFSIDDYEESTKQGPYTSWYKLQIKGRFDHQGSQRYVLSVQSHIFRHLNVHLFEGDKLIKRESLGLLSRKGNNLAPYTGPDFHFEIKNNQSLTLLIEKQTYGTALLPMVLYSEEGYQSHLRFQNQFWASVISILLAMAFFNVLIYAMQPNNSYIWYLGFHLSSFTYIASISGFGFLLWPDTLQVWLAQNILFTSTLIMYFGLRFLKSFLECEKHTPQLVKWFLPLRVATLCMSGVSLYFYEYQILHIVGIFLLLMVIFAFTVGITSLKNGFFPAKYYLISWVFPIIGGFIDIFYSLKILPFNFLTSNSFMLGTIMELFLLSIALASRIKHSENLLLNNLYIHPDTNVANFNYLKNVLPNKFSEIKSSLDHPFILIANLDGFKEVASLYGPKVQVELFKQHTITMNAYLEKQVWSIPFEMPNGQSCYLITLPSEQVLGLINLPKDGIDSTLTDVMNQIMHESDGMLTNKEYNSQIRLTVGCAEITDDIESAYRQAQVALLTSLRLRKKWTLFSHEHEKIISEHTLIVHELKEAIAQDHLTLSIQPKFHLHNQSLSGGEILLRWNHRDFGDFSPAKFIPLAEQSGMVFNITQLVISKTFAWVATLQNLENLPKKFSVAINLSVLDMSEPRLTSFIASRLEFYKLDSKWITFEITESAAHDNPAQIIQTIKVLKLLGFRISIDDFGTGYSSMVYLQNIEPDEIKIDMGFIRDIHKDRQKQHIVKAIVELARSSGAKTVAEGIETEAELEHVQGLHCDSAQGYLWSKSLTLEEFEQLYLKQDTNLKDI